MGISLNASSLNAISLNASSLNASSLNASSLNAISLNASSLNASSLAILPNEVPRVRQVYHLLPLYSQSQTPCKFPRVRKPP